MVQKVDGIYFFTLTHTSFGRLSIRSVVVASIFHNNFVRLPVLTRLYYNQDKKNEEEHKNKKLVVPHFVKNKYQAITVFTKVNVQDCGERKLSVHWCVRVEHCLYGFSVRICMRTACSTTVVLTRRINSLLTIFR